MPRPKKTDLARFKAMNDLGVTPNNIARRTGYDPKTVRKYLTSEVYQDPDIQRMVDTIREKELNDLYLLGAKARMRLHELLDEGKTKAIETTAIMDRTFQQRQLLSGGSTQNLSISALIVSVHEKLRESDAHKKDKKG